MNTHQQIDRVKALAQNAARPWYRMVVDSTDDSAPARIDLFGEIGWEATAQDFTRELNALDVEHIEMHVNSPGGNVFDGITIMNALRQHKAQVTAVVDGLAASAASFIAFGGADVVKMAPNSEAMVHEASGLCLGNATDMTKMAEDLNRISDNIASVYSDRAGGTVAEWRDVMKAETWFSAEEAVEAGLADEVLPRNTRRSTEQADDDPEAGPAARFDLSVFAHAGRRNAPAPKTPAASASGTTTNQHEESTVAFTPEQLDNLRQLAGVATNADEGTILAALGEALSEVDPQPVNRVRQTIPEGMTLVEADVFNQLREDAAAGRAARDQQQSDQRAALVNSAVQDGRISPARREHWLNALQADEGAAEVLASLEPGLVPVNEVGHAGNDLTNEVDPASVDNYWFPGVATARTGLEV